MKPEPGSEPDIPVIEHPDLAEVEEEEAVGLLPDGGFYLRQ